MSTSPNQVPQVSPPSSVTGAVSETAPAINKVVVPLPVIQHHDDIYYYVFVKGSLYSPDSAVFGLEPTEIQALSKKFNSPCKEIENGIMFKKSVIIMINALSQLGYKVISTCGDAETLFTLQRELD